MVIHFQQHSCSIFMDLSKKTMFCNMFLFLILLREQSNWYTSGQFPFLVFSKVQSLIMSLLWTSRWPTHSRGRYLAASESPANSPISYSTDATVLPIPVITKARMETIYSHHKFLHPGLTV